MRVSRSVMLMFTLFSLVSSALLAGERSASEVLLEGKQLEKAGKTAEAVEVFRKAIREHPSEALYSACGSLLGKLSKLNDAATLLNEGLKQFPDSPSLLNVRGLVLLRQGKPEQAAQDWKKVLAREPNNAFARDWLKKAEKPGAAAARKPATPGVEPGSTPEPEPTPDVPAKASGLNDQTLTIKPLAQPGSPEEQAKKAKAIYTQMAGMSNNDLDALEALHLQVIQECPDTDFARESIFMLSNMYQFATANPLIEKQSALLDYLLEKYPGSDPAVLLMNRIVNTYRAAGKPEKLVGVYSKALTNPNIDDRSFIIYGLDYAKALQETGKKDEARNMLTAVIARDGTNNSFEAGVAKNLLTQWK